MALGSLLVLQGLLLYRGSLGLPDVFLARLHEELEERGWQAEYASLRYYPPGTLIVNDLALAPEGEPQALMNVELGRIGFSLTKLLRGELAVKEATVYGGTLFCPARLSPTGVREGVLERTHLTAAPAGDGWEIRNLNGKLHNVSFSASGIVPRLAPAKKDPERLEALLALWLPRIVRERAAFERAENPHLRARVAPAPAGGLSVEAEAWADGFAAPLPDGWASLQLPLNNTGKRFVLPSGPLRVLQPYATTRWTYDGETWVAEGLSLSLERLEWETLLAARRLSADFHWPAGKPTDLSATGLDLAAAELTTPAGALGDLRAALRSREEDRLTAGFSALFQDLPIEGTAELNWRLGNGSAQILSRINPTPFLQSEIARELGLKRDIRFEEAPFARATARMEDWQFVKASARALARQADIDGVFLHRAAATAELLPDRLIVPRMFLAYDDFEAEGRYEIELATKAYRLFFNGSARPLHIHAWFRDWWVSLWEDFEFPNDPLHGDIDIHGILGEPGDVRVAGSVGAKDFSLRGVVFKALDAKLIVAGPRTDLFDIDLVREEGTASGAFQYLHDRDSGGFGRLWFEAESRVDPTEVAAVFGEAGRNFMSSYRFMEPPSLSLKGAFYGPPRADQTRILVQGETDAPLQYHGLPLSRLKLTAEVEGETWRLFDLSAGLAGGEVTGRVDKWEEDGTERLGFTLFMRGLDLEPALAAVAAWQAEAGLEKTEVRDLKGVADLFVDASGTHGDFQSFVGEGSVRIREADFAQVHLLGLLSRILSATPLGFTSLEFSEADAQFNLELNKLRLTEVHLTGPTSTIRAAGDYLIDQQALDASLRIYLLKETKIPFLSLILSPLLEPLAHMMEIRLTGPVTDPQWRFLLGPRNILKTISEGREESRSPGQ